MKKILPLVLVLVLAGCTGEPARTEETELWPEIEPFRTGHLRVSDIHEIYYELCGSSGGRPVFVLHGGPGGSSSPYMRRFFNPEAFLVVLHDQRGSGKSRPFAETRENTTQHLVEDIERLRGHLGLGEIILFGGSWGSTLALAYAETYPENVAAMVLRGIFTSKKDEIDHFYHGGVRTFFPEVYDGLMSKLPGAGAGSVPARLLALIEAGDSTAKYESTRAWAEYEIKISGLNVPDEALDDILRDFNPLAFGLLENYYMANGCFFEEGQILRDAHRIGDIPTVLVNGRYDMICPPVNAYRLHRELPGSELIIAESAGHWMGEPPIQRALLRAMKNLE